LDTGVDPTHPDLAGKLTLGKNFYDNNDDWTDRCGHGTSVAGTAAAITDNGIGVAGVGWNNPIIPIKVTNEDCWGSYSAMAQGIVYAADNGAKSANISFHIYNGAALSDAAKYMNDKGGWVVAAAGNTGKFEDYPENPYIISVGSVYRSNDITSFSSKGPYVDFSAPGSGILTTKKGGSYGSVTGTSFSSPMVAGLVGLLASNNPAMSAQQIYDTIQSTALDLGSAGRDDFYGWGKINAAAALESSTPVEDIISPSVSITNPTDSQDVSGTFTVNVDSSDNVAVSNVELYADNLFYDQKSSEPYDFLVDAATMSEGTLVLKAVSYDTSDNFASSQINVNVIPEIVNEDITPPDVSIVSPSDGDIVNGRVSVLVSASDSSGVDFVRIFVDGNLKKTLSDTPYSYTWNTNQVSTGIHSITAQAYDTMGISNEDSISVELQKENTKKGEGEEKFLEIKGDAATSSSTLYQVIVSGQISLGPKANPADKLSTDGTTINGKVFPTGRDNYYFTGDIVSITAGQHVFSFVDGVEVTNDSLAGKSLEIKGDSATSSLTTYQVIVSGQILLGPNANPNDKLSTDGTTINGKVKPTGLDNYFFTGDIVSITADQHVFSFVNGVEILNDSLT